MTLFTHYPGYLCRLAVCWFVVLSFSSESYGQDNRIHFGGRDLFLSGGNIAWINFAADIGPGNTRLDLFEEMFQEMNEHGGNSFRLWLHTNGTSTPEFSGMEVVGPGVGAIEDLTEILDLAYFYDIGLKLCLWSFDMLQSGLSSQQIARNRALLTDDEAVQAYIENALIPMVAAIRGHPALLSWEIFNEPEGMTTQFGWTPFGDRVSMSDVQWFINHTAGAIRRTDPDTPVTNGSWNIRASSDGAASKAAIEPERTSADLSPAELEEFRAEISETYRTNFTTEKAADFLDRLNSHNYHNYYRDDRLIEAGGDPDGILDFYSVHYYKHFPTSQSPFHNDASHWDLDRPIVIGEFYLSDPRQDGDPDGIYGVHWADLHEELYTRGYAGAMGWQWFDWWANRTDMDGVDGTLNWPRMLANMQTMLEQYPDDVAVILPGLRTRFSAFPEGIEEGGTSTLTWAVRGALTVLLDGEPADHEGSREVTPTATTTYTLIAEDDEGNIEELEITVTVLDPLEVNRALQKPAFASSEEIINDQIDNPVHHVNDGDTNTRWSSQWEDNEWIYIDLEGSYDVHEVVLNWETAYGSSYDIDVSFDGVHWTTVHEERSGDGGAETIEFDPEVPARFVRMNGHVRGTEWGFSLWEFEVRGLLSDRQPPQISIVSPIENAFLEANVPVAVEAQVQTGTLEVEKVEFYLNGDLVESFSEGPYTYLWENSAEGTYTWSAVVYDSDFDIHSIPREAVIRPESESIRFEAEDAMLAGSAQVMNDPQASGGAYVNLQDAAGTSLTWEDIQIPEGGAYGLRIGFRLPYDDPKGQDIQVNDVVHEEVMFTGELNEWLTLDITVELVGGANTISIEGVWGWMDIDYMEVRGQNLHLTAAESDGVVDNFSLHQNYPNPFNPATTISYSLPESGQVRLDVFDVSGRRVKTLVDAKLSAGEHTSVFDGRGLATGVYVYRLESGSFVRTKHMVLIR